MPHGARGETLRATKGEVMSKILVAYDGSDSGRRALAETARIAAGNTVTVVSVAEPMSQFGRTGELMLPEEDADRRRDLAEAKQLLADCGVDAAVVERKGDPATRILDEAEQEHADLLVLGTRGLGRTKRWLLGSVSTRVLQHASCNVLVVR
jgi:nucleotide-binding universal stress UspA family protein